MDLRILVVFASILSLVSAVSAATLPSGFDEFIITGPIQIGTTLEFAPDGKLFVLEKGGSIQVYEGSGATLWTQVAPANNFFIGESLVVNSSGEAGLFGIAFDPEYMRNRYLYVHYKAAKPTLHSRVSRFTASADGTQVVIGSEAVIMDLETSTSTLHNGGGIHFGPDGKLYVAVGDHLSSSNAQSINSRFGKILRLNPDPANPIPDDNPLSIAGIAGTPTGLNRAIWAAGLRNPYTFAFKPGSNLMYINDVGDDTWEEINIGIAGANYAWPREGPFNQVQLPHLTHPIVYYHHDNYWLSYPTPHYGFRGHAITGGAFYAPSVTMFPADFIGNFFFGDFMSGWINRFDPVANTVQNFAWGAVTPVDVRIGPDGALYYLSYNTGRVFRVRFKEPCTGDVDPPGGNGISNVMDLLAIFNHWGQCSPPAPCPSDTNGDLTVNVSDVLTVINAWGPCM